jgi:hypothetical protein
MNRIQTRGIHDRRKAANFGNLRHLQLAVRASPVSVPFSKGSQREVAKPQRRKEAVTGEARLSARGEQRSLLQMLRACVSESSHLCVENNSTPV